MKQTQVEAKQPLRQEIRQHPERARPEAVAEILKQGYLVHVAYAEGSQPYLIPFSYHYEPSVRPASEHAGEDAGVLYLHGSQASHTLNYLAAGARACLEVTQVDGLVYSRTALHHSMNYRSVVCFGRGQKVQDRQHKAQVLEAMIARYYPGRKPEEDYQAAPDAVLDTTLVVAIPLEAATAKVRQGGANGPQDTQSFAAGSAGVVALEARHEDWRAQHWFQPPFRVSTERSELPLERLFDLLKDAYWNPGLSLERLQRRLEHSLGFRLYHERELIGFARLLSDGDSFAYLADVMVAPEWRGQGLGRWLMSCVQAHPVMQQIRWCLLSTRDAQSFYTQVGFQPHEFPERLMIYRPAVSE